MRTDLFFLKSQIWPAVPLPLEHWFPGMLTTPDLEDKEQWKLGRIIKTGFQSSM